MTAALSLPQENVVDSHRYEILGRLGSGGMAMVYLGRLRGLLGFSRLVAIKCMHPQYVMDADFTDMFLDEARLTARIRHPNVASSLDVVADGKQVLNVMEYIEGESLFHLVRAAQARKTLIPVPIACAIIHDVLCGLHAAHETQGDDGQLLNIVHRDVSPQNILVSIDGSARVLDFGIAKARGRLHQTRDGQIKGKVAYMPPEQLFGDELDRRADIYATGVMLWEALTCQRLFDGANETAAIARVMNGLIEPPSRRVRSFNRELDALVLRAMSASPRARFATALEMASALQSIAPLAPRVEVAAWMTDLARPNLEERTRMARASGVAHGEPPPPERLVLTTLNGGPARESKPEIENVVLITETPVRKSWRESWRPASWLLGLVALAGSVAAFAWLQLQSGTAARPQAIPMDDTWGAPPVVESLPAPPSSAPSPFTAPAVPIAANPPPAPTPPFAPPPRSSAETSPSARVRVAAPVATQSTPERDGSNCRPPYTVDSNGQRHFKLECL